MQISEIVRKRAGWIGALAIVVFVLAACMATMPVAEESVAEESATEATAAPQEEAAEEASPLDLLPAEEPPFSTANWSTDFSKRLVEWDEILSGGPPKDGIPSIDDPSFESVTEAGAWLGPRDPVMIFAHNDDVRAYPLAILIWHEIVNDTVGGKPVAVTFCPLCNASIVFDAELGGQVLDFGTTGKLRNSDLVMYDRQTESWWQQFTGQAIVGELVGQQLDFLPSQVLSFRDLAAEFPDAQVLARPNAPRSYGENPYTNYDSTVDRPFLYSGELDTRLPSTERVVGVELNDVTMAYPFPDAAAAGAINDSLGETAVVVLHKAGTASALDGRIIADSKDVGSTGVFVRTVDGETLTFSPTADGLFTDTETGSTWNILGEATDGPLAGTKLAQVTAFDHFWFAWSAFHPDTGLYNTE